MSRHDDQVTLRHMRDYVEEAVNLVGDRSKADLETDRVVFLASLKLVENVGESATRISKAMTEAHPYIPWREIIGTRNRLIHGYDDIDVDILWEIMSADFPALLSKIEALIVDHKGPP